MANLNYTLLRSAIGLFLVASSGVTVLKMNYRLTELVGGNRHEQQDVDTLQVQLDVADSFTTTAVESEDFVNTNAAAVAIASVVVPAMRGQTMEPSSMTAVYNTTSEVLPAPSPTPPGDNTELVGSNSEQQDVDTQQMQLEVADLVNNTAAEATDFVNTTSAVAMASAVVATMRGQTTELSNVSAVNNTTSVVLPAPSRASPPDDNNESLREDIPPVGATPRQPIAVANISQPTSRPFLTLPTPNNTVIAMIHHIRKNNKVERLVCSLRERGQWDGPVLVLVDTEEFVHFYNDKFSQQPYNCGGSNVYIAKGRDDDLAPKNSTGHPIPYRSYGETKRFKTLLWDYLPAALNGTVEYILYMDEDNVVGKPLQELFTSTGAGLYDQMVYHTGLKPPDYVAPPRRARRIAPPRLNMSKTESFMMVIPSNGVFHGGMFLTHGHYSRFCLDMWRYQFDTIGRMQTSDQQMLYPIPEITQNKCDFVVLPGNVMTFPTPDHARSRSFNYFVHFTNYRMRKLRNNETQAFFLDLLGKNASDPMITSMFGTDEFSLL